MFGIDGSGFLNDGTCCQQLASKPRRGTSARRRGTAFTARAVESCESGCLRVRVKFSGLRVEGQGFRLSCFVFRLHVQTAGGKGEDLGFRV